MRQSLKCSNFDRSGYEVIKLFNPETPKTVAEAYEELLSAKTRILLGAEATIEDYIYSLCSSRELAQKDGGYVLTRLGVMERDRLEKLIQETDMAKA